MIMIIGLYIIGSMFSLLALLSKVKELSYQLNRVKHERDVYACTLESVAKKQFQTIDDGRQQ